MRSRRQLCLAGITALAAMLFAQAAFAIASCNAYRSHGEMRVAAVRGAQPAPCHESQPDASLCYSHCQSGDQSLDKHQLKVPDLQSQPVLVIRGERASYSHAPLPAPALAPGAGPPLHLLYLSLLF